MKSQTNKTQPSLKLRRAMGKIKKLPDGPGVYMFVRRKIKKTNKKILYVGKATSLRDRVRSYFNKNIEETRSPLISKMLSEFDDIEFIETSSVLEALVLEANLIKKYQPEANIKEKDDRSFNFVVITDEDFPRVLVMRGREIQKMKKEDNLPPTPSLNLREGAESVLYYKEQKWGRVSSSVIFSFKKTFGPFPNGGQLKEAMKIVRKMFPFRDRCIPAEEQKKRALAPRSFIGVGCFNRQIGLCPGVCTGEISKKEYAKTIKNIVLFFESDKKRLLTELKKEMKEYTKAREFEKAEKAKRQIFALQHIQDISLLKKESVSRGALDIETRFRIEGYDIAHLSGTNTVGVMVVLENGEIKKTDYRKFIVKSAAGKTGGIGDTVALSEILYRRLAHSEWPLPDLVVVDGGIAQKNAAEKILKEHSFNIPVVSVVKDERHKPREILKMNQKSGIMNYGKGEEKKGYGKEELERQILLTNAEAHRFAISFHRHLRRKMKRFT